MTFYCLAPPSDDGLTSPDKSAMWTASNSDSCTCGSDWLCTASSAGVMNTVERVPPAEYTLSPGCNGFPLLIVLHECEYVSTARLKQQRSCQCFKVWQLTGENVVGKLQAGEAPEWSTIYCQWSL